MFQKIAVPLTIALFAIAVFITVSGCTHQPASSPIPLSTTVVSVRIAFHNATRNDPFLSTDLVVKVILHIEGEQDAVFLRNADGSFGGSIAVHFGSQKAFQADALDSAGKVIFASVPVNVDVKAAGTRVELMLYSTLILGRIVSKVTWAASLLVAKITVSVEEDDKKFTEQFTINGADAFAQSFYVSAGSGRKVTVIGLDANGAAICSAAPMTVSLAEGEIKVLNFILLPVSADLSVEFGISSGLPRVVITSTPALGQSGKVSGMVSGSINPSKMCVVLYTFRNGHWDTRAGLVGVNNLTGSSFVLDLIDADASATKVAVFLLPKDAAGPFLTGMSDLPTPDGAFSVSIYDRQMARFQALCGVNLPWYNYGWDVGRQPWGGAHGGYSVNTNYAPDLVYLKSVGVNLVRIFVWCDLRSGVVFDANGMPKSLDQYAAGDFDAMVKTAEDKGMKLLLVLFDHTVADNISVESGGIVGEHADVITDPAKTQALIALLKPLIAKHKDSQAIYGYDIINEPELAVAVAIQQLQSFVQLWASAIHDADPNALVTVGSHTRLDIHKWSNLGLNFSQCHYYDDSLVSAPFDFPFTSIPGAEGFTLIGETDPSNMYWKIDTAYKNGYAGILFWSLNANWLFRFNAGPYKEWMAAHPIIK